MNRYEAHWAAELNARSDQGLLRSKPLCVPESAAVIVVDGRIYHSFASNDYLGLAGHPEVRSAAQVAIEKFGVGGGASHMVCGHHQEHELLENELAEFTGREKALVFSSGYMANLALVSTLVGRTGAVFQDRLNHASLLDGGLLSGARFQRYLHNDPGNLKKRLEKFNSKIRNEVSGDADLPKALVVTDGVFSMDGDVANLAELSKVCSEHEALLMVDDAHGFGVIGDSGAGSVEMFGLDSKAVPVLIGTFGKAFGTAGAFVAGSKLLIDYIEQFARPYIYTTSMPPLIAAATRKSIELIQDQAGPRAQLLENIELFRECASALELNLMPSNTAIQPILIGPNDGTIRVAEALKNEGFMVGAIRPPTVPNNQARLRVTLSAAHKQSVIKKLVESLARHTRGVK